MVSKHIWNDYVELAEDFRHTPEYAELYRLRKEKIERVFADAKEKHAMRYTPYRGLTAVKNWVRLLLLDISLPLHHTHHQTLRCHARCRV